MFFNLIRLRNVSGDENLYDISKYAPNHDDFLDNNSYTILYKAIANSLVSTVILYLNYINYQ